MKIKILLVIVIGTISLSGKCQTNYKTSYDEETSVYSSYDSAVESELLSKVNDIRAKYKLPSLAQTKKLECDTIAKRLAEATIYDNYNQERLQFDKQYSKLKDGWLHMHTSWAREKDEVMASLSAVEEKLKIKDINVCISAYKRVTDVYGEEDGEETIVDQFTKYAAVMLIMKNNTPVKAPVKGATKVSTTKGGAKAKVKPK